MGSIAAGQRIKASDFAWTTWTPTYTNLTSTGATIEAHYRQLGDTVEFYWRFIYGTGSAVGTSPSFSLPVAMASFYNSQAALPFDGEVRDAGTAGRQVQCAYLSSTTVTVNFWNATPTVAGVTATSPFTFGSGDMLTVWGSYKVA